MRDNSNKPIRKSNDNSLLWNPTHNLQITQNNEIGPSSRSEKNYVNIPNLIELAKSVEYSTVI